jgi:hypothetical protein
METENKQFLIGRLGLVDLSSSLFKQYFTVLHFDYLNVTIFSHLMELSMCSNSLKL